MQCLGQIVLTDAVPCQLRSQDRPFGEQDAYAQDVQQGGDEADTNEGIGAVALEHVATQQAFVDDAADPGPVQHDMQRYCNREDTQRAELIVLPGDNVPSPQSPASRFMGSREDNLDDR